MSVLRALLVLLVAVVPLAGCSGGSSGSAGSSATSSSSGSATASGSATSSAPAPPVAPRRAACYRLSPRQLTQPTNDSHPVSCAGRHTARTIFVGHLDTVVDGHSVAVDSARVQRQLATTCPRKLAAYVGGSPGARDLSRFNVVWYSPSIAQSDRGANWFRCDLIAFARDQQLAALPHGAALRGALDRPGALATYGLCGTAAPGAPGFQRVACGQPHSWRAMSTVPLSGGRAYPGAATVRTAGDGSCRAQARARASDALKFRYGWEWPTAEQWRAGQHYGYCWIPA